jgi:hypothetical protein
MTEFYEKLLSHFTFGLNWPTVTGTLYEELHVSAVWLGNDVMDDGIST